MTTLIAPLTSFGGVPFTILSDEGRVPEWTRELRINEQKVPSSDLTITQIDGYGPWTLECRLLFATVADWQAFDALRGTRQAFRHLAAITATAPATALRTHLGDEYVTWQDVLYAGPTEPPRRIRDGRVLARVRFTRRSG